jgi:SAM-dependent methyltransferase
MKRTPAALVTRIGQRLFPHDWPKLRMALHRTLRPARLGSLGTTHPLSRSWGRERGNPVDRYYIESFLAAHRSDIRGRVLEVKDNTYTTRYGSGVEAAEVLDIDPANLEATVIADLSAAHSLPAEQFDCFILTQTLQLIFDTAAALEHAHRILRPGGVLLATVPSVSRIIPATKYAMDYWRFTVASCTSLFERTFGPGQVQVHSYGNVTSAIAFLAGAVQEDLRPNQLDATDEHFPVLIAVSARKRVPSKAEAAP